MHLAPSVFSVHGRRPYVERLGRLSRFTDRSSVSLALKLARVNNVLASFALNKRDVSSGKCGKITNSSFFTTIVSSFLFWVLHFEHYLVTFTVHLKVLGCCYESQAPVPTKVFVLSVCPVPFSDPPVAVDAGLAHLRAEL